MSPFDLTSSRTLVLVLSLSLLGGTEASATAVSMSSFGVPWCGGVAALPLEVEPVKEVPTADFSPKAGRGDAQRETNTTPTPVSLNLLQVDWEVDIHGTMARGVLFQDFENQLEVPVRARLFFMPPPNMSIGDVKLDFDAETLTADIEPAVQPSSGSNRRSKRRARSEASFAKMSQIFELGPKERFTSRVEFNLPVSFVEGAYVLELPRVSSACASEVRLMKLGRERPGAAERTRETPMGVNVRIDRKAPLQNVMSDTHLVRTTASELGAEVLLGEEAVAGSGFRLSYAVGELERAAGETWIGPDQDGWRDVMLLVTPPLDPPSDRVRSKDVLFLIDSSGSMRGGKLEEAREALNTSLASLNPLDRFNLLSFSSEVKQFKEAFVPVTVADLDEGRGWLESLAAQGGTQLKPGLSRALEMPRQPNRHQLLVVLTDGILADEDAVAEFLDKKLGDTNLLVVGIGQEPELRAISRLADIGRGSAVLARNPGQLEETMARLLAEFAEPLAWDLSIDWGDAQVSKVSPKRLPDLHGGRPLTVHARVHGLLPHEVRVLGATTDGPSTFEANMPLDEATELPELERPTRSRD